MAPHSNPFARQQRTTNNWGPSEVRTVLEVVHHFPSLVSPETSAAEARLVAVRAGVHHLPVVSEQGDAVGVVCRCGLMSAPLGATVKECMRSPAIAVRTDTSLEEASAVMLERGVGCLPVIYEDTVVGVVTRADLVEAGALSEGTPHCSNCGSYDHVGVAEANSPQLCRRCKQGRALPDSLETDELAFGD
jgi:CBS-domain-containing membrane protein